VEKKEVEERSGENDEGINEKSTIVKGEEDE
jgi:hypothetical protein